MSRSNSLQDAWIVIPAAEKFPGGPGDRSGHHRLDFVPNVARLLAITANNSIYWWNYFDELTRTIRAPRDPTRDDET